MDRLKLLPDAVDEQTSPKVGGLQMHPLAKEVRHKTNAHEMARRLKEKPQEDLRDGGGAQEEGR